MNLKSKGKNIQNACGAYLYKLKMQGIDWNIPLLS